MKATSNDLLAGKLALNNARQARISAYQIMRAYEKGLITPELLKAMGLNLHDLKNLLTQTANQETDCANLLREMEDSIDTAKRQRQIRRYNGMS